MLYDVSESGPFDILNYIRYWVGVYEDDPGQLAEAVTCPYCISVWVGALFAAISLNDRLFRIIAWPFAASAVVVILHERYGQD